MATQRRKPAGNVRAEPQGPLGHLLLEAIDKKRLGYPRTARLLNTAIKKETGVAAGMTRSSLRNWISRWVIPNTDAQRALMTVLGIQERKLAQAIEAQHAARAELRGERSANFGNVVPAHDISLTAATAATAPSLSSGDDPVAATEVNIADGEFISIPVQTATGVIAYVITRRAFLASLATTMPALAVPERPAGSLAPTTARLTDVADLLVPSPYTLDRRPAERNSFLTVTRLLASQRQAVAPDALLSLVEAHRDSLATLFRKATSDPVRSDIGALLGETSIVASRLWSAMGNRSLAIANCAYARQLADKLDDPILGATARIFESNLHSEAATLIGAEGDVVLGLRMLEEAGAVGHALSPAARARIAAEQAQAYAVLTLRRECQEALDRARRAVEEIDDPDRTGLFSDWSPSRLLVYEGTCWLFLGEAKKAVSLLNQALQVSESDQGNVNVLLAARVDLASAYAESGELEEGCSLLAETYARLTDIGNRRGIERAWRARERLGPWEHEPQVHDLDERIGSSEPQ